MRTRYLLSARSCAATTTNYYPSSGPVRDLGPPSLQRQSVGQNRTLTNAGLRSDLSYAKGVNQIKAGVVYQQTFLNENDTIGIVDPTYNAPCITSVATSPVNPYPYVAAPGLTVADCPSNTGPRPAKQRFQPERPRSAFYPYYNPILAPYDLTRGGSPYTFNGHTGCEGTRPVLAGRHHKRKLVFEPRLAR